MSNTPGIKGEAVLISYYDDRFYKIVHETKDKDITEYYPSVTTKLGILQPKFLAKWRGDVGNREADMIVFDAQERGKRIHKAWEVLGTGGVVVYSNWQNPVEPQVIEDLEKVHPGMVFVIPYQDEMLDVWKLQKFCEIVKPKFLKSEFMVFSHKHKEAGTADNLFDIEGGSYPVDGYKSLTIPKGIYLADLKSGKGIEKWQYQTARYAAMVEEIFGIEIAGTMCLHTRALTKSGIAGFKVHLRFRDQMLQDLDTYRAIATVWDRENVGIQPKLFDFPQIIKLEK